MDSGKEFKTSSSMPVKRIYAPSDLEESGFCYDKHLGDAGAPPYVRGISRDMYRSQLWVMGQYGGYGGAEESNKRYKSLIAQGATGISLALDLPTQIGYDSDHPMSHGEVGKVGVAIDSLKDAETLFDGIPLEKLRQVRTTANSVGPIFAALFCAIAEQQQIPPNSFCGYFQNDVLKEYVARGTQIFPPKAGVKLCTDVIEYCTKHLRNWIPLNFCGYHIRDAGGTAVHEVAFSFANAITYIESSLERGLEINQFVPTMTCFLGAGLDLFEEVAKFRAARRVWVRLLRERYGVSDPGTLALRIFSYTLGSNLVAQQPLNNIVRVTIEALGAVLGGVQILATSSYDEALSTPSAHAATIALRTQQVIANESGVINTVDPLGGSYFLEKLTLEIEEEVWKYLKKIDELGGSISAIESGFFAQEIEKASFDSHMEIEAKDRIVVGLNEYRSQEDIEVEAFEVDPEVERKQIERLASLKKIRDATKVEKCLTSLRQVAIKNGNIIPPCLAAVKAYATLGEICDCLRDVYGEYCEQYAMR